MTEIKRSFHSFKRKKAVSKKAFSYRFSGIFLIVSLAVMPIAVLAAVFAVATLVMLPVIWLCGWM